MMTDHEWKEIASKAFPARSVEAPAFLWTRILARIESEEVRRSSVWWMQWRWLLKMTFAIGLFATASSYYLLDHTAVPLESALEGISAQQQAIILAHNPNVTAEEAADMVAESDS